MTTNSDRSSARSTRLWDWLQVVVAFTALAFTAGWLLSDSRSFILRSLKGEEQGARLELEISRLKRDLDALDARVESLAEPAPDLMISSKIQEISTKQEALDERLQGIEEIVLANPMEALAIPMIRKDIERLEEVNSVRLGAFSEDLERQYNLVITVLAALALSVWAPALARIIRRSPDRPADAVQSGGEKRSPNQAGGTDG